MKMLKRWLAFFVVVVLLIGVAFNGRSPIAASQIDKGDTTEGAAAEPAMEQQGSETSEDPDNSNSGSNGDTNGATVQEIVPDTQASESQPAASIENIENGTAVHQDAMELKQEVKDENGEVICTVTANLQDGTFEADASEVSMEVAAVEPNISEEVKALMETTIGEGQTLGEYFFYHIIFKINGVPTEPGREVKITFEPKDYQIADVKKARAFYYNEANSIAGNQQAEIIEITQKADKIEQLQNAGQSIDNIDDYDLAEITLRDDGSADKIQMEGRRSTIYGCYLIEPRPEDETKNDATSTEGEAKEEETEGKTDISGTAGPIEDTTTLQYEDENVSVMVSANKEGIIPADSKLKVIPVLPDDKKTKDQYKEVEDKLKDKAKNENYSIAGFLAYDISFVDEDGKEVEPDGEVKVTLDYKKAALPQNVDKKIGKDAEVTVLHLEEDEKGKVKDVVDMNKANKVETVKTTKEQKVEKVEFTTDSFSYYTLVWSSGYYGDQKINIHYCDTEGTPINVPGIGTGTKRDIDVNDPIDFIQGDSDYIKTIENYSYVETRIGTDSPGETEITSLQLLGKWKYSWYSTKFQYKTSSSSSWKDAGDNDDVYIVYSKKVTPPDPVNPQLGDPEHHKQIKANADGTYSLSLDVKGEVGKGTPIDVLLIIDKSGSMQDNNKYSNVNTAIEALKTGLADADTTINVAAVTFSSAGTSEYASDSDYTYSQRDNLEDAWIYGNGNSWQDINRFSFSLKSSDCTGGTNWQAGIRKGEELLSQRANVNSQKYVLFLTDGQPTFRYLNGSGTITQGSGRYYSEVGSNNYNYAKDEWTTSPYLYAATKYVIDATNGSDLNAVCNSFSKEVGATIKKGNDKNTLIKTFTEIANDILRPAYKNVMIKDKLSDYADFAFDKNSETTVNRRTYHPSIKLYKVDKNGRETVLTEYKDYTLTINYETEEVEASVLNGNQLEDGYTYQMRFDIIPSPSAVTAHLEGKSYDGTGEEDTDAPGNTTSSGQIGFYSNDKDNAFVEYTVNDSDKKAAEYQKPVIQVKNTKKMVEKVWQGTPAESVNITITATAMVNGKEIELDYINNLLPGVTLDEEGGWLHTWSNLPKYHYYMNDRHKAVRTEITYTIDEPDVPAGYEKTIAPDPENADKTIITNASLGSLAVKKVWSDGFESHSNDSILVGLYKEGVPVMENGNARVATLSAENDWAFAFDHLGTVDGYSVKELREAKATETAEITIDGKNYIGIDSGESMILNGIEYVIGYGDIILSTENDKNGSIAITNTASWEIIKQSSSDRHPRLNGAKFSLTKDGDNFTVYYGRSEGEGDNEGTIQWYKDAGFKEPLTINEIENGTYTLRETKAPDGYAVAGPWKIAIENGYPTSIMHGLTPITNQDNRFYIENDPVYALPQAGGPGIFWYTAGGTLLMILAGMLALYKSKKSEAVPRN